MPSRWPLAPSLIVERRLPDAPALAGLLEPQLRVGDALLTGCAEPLSWIIRTGSRSEFSHMAVVTGRGSLIEAYDYAMTPTETDEGIYSISLAGFLARPTRPRLLEIRRPLRLDPDRLVTGARWLLEHSPGFPTIGMACLALCGLTGPLLRLMPEPTRRRVLLRQAALAADGSTRMHCAEAATRLYLHAGVPLRFPSPRLRHHIEVIGRPQPPWGPARLPTAHRTARPGHWPEGRLRAGIFAARSIRQTWRERRQAPEEIDLADLILPGDYHRAQPFATVARFRYGPQGWTAVGAPPGQPRPASRSSVTGPRLVVAAGAAPGSSPPASAGSREPRSTGGEDRRRRSRW